MNLTHAIGWTLLHFLWQGALIAALLAAALAFLRQARSSVRYAAACVAMTLMLSSATATFVELSGAGERRLPPATSTASWGVVAGPLHMHFNASQAAAVTDYLPAIVWAWLGGVLALTIRALGGWAVAQRFARRNTRPAEPAWEQRFAALAERLRIAKPVTLAVSALAQVPAVVGWMRPVVLVPAGVFAGLTAEQIEALLAHELAHVRRYDYLVNLLQTAAETLFFYHPAVWWVSRKIRDEREHCCDDLAVETCGNTMTYVRALTELEQLRAGTPRLAMAADGGSLVSRVQRLLRVNQNANGAPSNFLAGAAIVTLVFVAALANNGLAQRPDTQPQEPQDVPQGWLEAIEAEGYSGLDVDQIIRLKEHNVDAAYIHQIRAAGLELTVDELIRFREHGVTAEFIDGMKQTGLKDLTGDDVIRLSEHGADPAWIRQMQSLGFEMPVDSIIRFQEHGVTVALVNELKQAGFGDLTVDDVIRLSEHGVTPGLIRQIQASYAHISVDEIVRLSERGITPEFIREARAHFKELAVDQLIRLQEFGIIGSK